MIDIDEDNKGRTCLVITELPYMVNPDNLAEKIADLARLRPGPGHRRRPRRHLLAHRAAPRGRAASRDAVARVVLNNLLKHTELQTNFSANMLALVDGVPRTLTLDQFISHWVEHQIEVIRRRTEYLLREAEERAHILRGLAKALDALDEVIALIRRSPDVAEARAGLIELLEIDELQANAILDMQLRRWPRWSARRSSTSWPSSRLRSPTSQDILANVDPAAADRRRRARRDRREVRRRPAHPDHRRPTATSRWRT